MDGFDCTLLHFAAFHILSAQHADSGTVMPQKDVDREIWLDEVVTLTEAATLRKISVETLRLLIRQGRLKAIQQSRRKRGMTRREALRVELR